MTRRARRIAGVLLIASATGAAVLLSGAGASYADAQTVTAWWSATNLGDPVPAPPAPPDVPEGDLLVQGSNGAPASPLGPAPASSQAVAGLSFDLQPTDLVGDLTLPVAGSPPQQVSVMACKATATFTSAYGGPWSSVPPYDDAGCVPGAVHGDGVVFRRIGRLAGHGRLAVVVLPGPLDRVVFAAPTATTLDVRHGTGVGPAAPPIGTGVDKDPAGPAPDVGDAVPPAAPVGSIAAPGSIDLPDPGGAIANPFPPPEVAPPEGGVPAAGQPSLNPAALAGGLSEGSRRALALLVIALEVVGFALLARGTAPSTESAPVSGVGRFRRTRAGPAPQL